jgi:hypothetical protein
MIVKSIRDDYWLLIELGNHVIELIREQQIVGNWRIEL